jgi:hypothetical protein
MATESAGSGFAPGNALMSGPARAEDTEWHVACVAVLLKGLRDGTVKVCPHAGGARLLWADAGALPAVCCLQCLTEAASPLAERLCNLCRSGAAVGWVTFHGPDLQIALLAAVCDACETAGVLGQPRGQHMTGR